MIKINLKPYFYHPKLKMKDLKILLNKNDNLIKVKKIIKDELVKNVDNYKIEIIINGFIILNDKLSVSELNLTNEDMIFFTLIDV
jgi:small-conductance mechanosensitive channel